MKNTERPQKPDNRSLSISFTNKQGRQETWMFNDGIFAIPGIGQVAKLFFEFLFGKYEKMVDKILDTYSHQKDILAKDAISKAQEVLDEMDPDDRRKFQKLLDSRGVSILEDDSYLEIVGDSSAKESLKTIRDNFANGSKGLLEGLKLEHMPLISEWIDHMHSITPEQLQDVKQGLHGYREWMRGERICDVREQVADIGLGGMRISSLPDSGVERPLEGGANVPEASKGRG